MTDHAERPCRDAAEAAVDHASTGDGRAIAIALLAVVEAIDRLPVVITTKGTPTQQEIDAAHRTIRERMGDRPVRHRLHLIRSGPGTDFPPGPDHPAGRAPSRASPSSGRPPPHTTTDRQGHTMTWRDRARCANQPEWLDKPTALQLADCRACPVRAACLSFALDQGCTEVVYGGHKMGKHPGRIA